MLFLSKECLKFYSLLVLCVLKHKHKCPFSSAHKHSGKKKKKHFKSIYFYFSFAVAVQLLSRVQLFVTPWTAACQISLFFTVFWSLLKLMSTESMMPSSHLILCCPLLLLPSILPSIKVFSNALTSSHQVAKVLEFQLHHQSFPCIFRVDFL